MDNRKKFLIYTTEEFALKLDEEVLRLRKEAAGQTDSHLKRNDLVLKIFAEYAKSQGWEVNPYPNLKK